MQNSDKNLFESKISPILQYVGAIGASIMSIAYIVLVFVLIIGFKAQNVQQTIIFALVNALVGFIIMQFLKVQGISFAKNLPENKEIIKAYYNSKTKDKKLRSIKSFWITSVLEDLFWKAGSLGLSTMGLIYIVIQGSNDFILLLLAAVNLFMFICFGLLALNKAYEFYNNYHVPYMIDKINDRISKGDIEQCLQSMERNIETLKNKSDKTNMI